MIYADEGNGKCSSSSEKTHISFMLTTSSSKNCWTRKLFVQYAWYSRNTWGPIIIFALFFCYCCALMLLKLLLSHNIDIGLFCSFSVYLRRDLSRSTILVGSATITFRHAPSHQIKIIWRRGGSCNWGKEEKVYFVHFVSDIDRFECFWDEKLGGVYDWYSPPNQCFWWFKFKEGCVGWRMNYGLLITCFSGLLSMM